jgi:hypothetical protein
VNERCGNCRFYSTLHGVCRFDPPRILMTPTMTAAGPGLTPQAYFPGVDAGQWCGKWSQDLNVAHP